MQKLILLGILLSGSSALAFDGTSRIDWIGKSVKDTALPYTGQPTVYVFAQPDCAACSLQLAALSAFQKNNSKLKITLVTEQNSVAFKEYLNGFALNPTIYADLTGDSLKALNLKLIPAVLYVNSGGIVEGFYEGTLTGAETRELSGALVAGKPLPRLTTPGGVGSTAPALPGVDWASNENHLLIFHSSICHFCNEELPYLTKYAKEHPEISVWIVATDNLEAVQKQFAGTSQNIKVVVDVEGKSPGAKLLSDYKAQGTPTQILISKEGDIKWRGDGFNAENLNPFEAGKIPLN